MTEATTTRWGMVVDLGRCVGCQTCTIACKMENGLPPDIMWRTVMDTETGIFPDVSRTFVPMTCMHCADPPCHDACPTTATRVRDDGIVWIDDDICIGCGSCVVACPYRARHIISTESYYFGQATEPELATYDKGRVGICTKCHFCYHKYDEAPEGVTPGVDPEYTPSCSSSCIGNAILFGDLNDSQSNVSRMIADNGNRMRMLEHLETDPSVYYLNAPEIENQQPQLQHSWHKLAVSNFFCGTTGFGLYLMGTVAGWFQGGGAPLIDTSDIMGSLSTMSLTVQHLAGLLGPLLVIVGLLSVGAEAGRPLRGLNVLRNLGRSWMSRESGFAMLFIALGLLDTLFLASPAVQAIAIICGIGIAVSQGLILSLAKGVPAWSVPIMPYHFLVSGLTAGCGALLLLTGLFGNPGGSSAGLSIAGIVLLAANLIIWVRYLRTPPRTATFERAVRLLKQPRYQAGIVGLGHVLPALLLAAVLFMPALTIPGVILAGVAMLAGGLISKAALILKASYLVDLFDGFNTESASSSESKAEAGARSTAQAA